ncbi:hypothetical protein AB9K35_20145 [Leisingera sp. XS_AS12]
MISTRSAPSAARWIMPSAVEKAQGNEASSTSDSALSMRSAWSEAATA